MQTSEPTYTLTRFLPQLLLMIIGLCCIFQPCDAANAPEGREKEDSTHELWGNNNGVCDWDQHF